MGIRLPLNYLRMYRKRAGLTQKELGLLVGYHKKGQVSRHERSQCAPSLRAALGYEAVFRTHVSALFPGIQENITEKVEAKLAEMENGLGERSAKDRGAKVVAQKLTWLKMRQGVETEENKRPGSKRFGRVIVLEVRPRMCGFVVFDGPTRLIDWGVRNFSPNAKGQTRIVAKRIGDIFDQYGPCRVVVGKRTDERVRVNRHLSSALRTIRREARRRALPLHQIVTAAVRGFFSPKGYTTRYEIASAVAELLEELAWKLPPKRKAWQSESPNALIFDAAALGMAFFAEEHEKQG